ncbi:MAG: MBL fold metallo-hydrolase [Acidimicrobiia bacterium]
MTLEHKRRLAFEYGVVDQLSPLVRRVICENPSPFTFTGTGTYIVGTGNVAVVDPGPDAPDHLNAIMMALDPGEAISHILVTHTHADHSPGARWLSKHTGAPVYASAAAVATEAAPESSTSSMTEEGTDRLFQPDQLLADGDTLAGDDWVVSALETPGHCREHLCFELATEHVMFTGDHIMAWATSVVVAPGGSMTDYLASLERVAQRTDIERLWPTHGPSVDDPQSYVNALITHRRDRADQIRALLENGVGNISEIVPILYAEYDRNVWFAAAATVHAHLIALVESGEVDIVNDAPVSMGAEFRLIRP